MNDKTRPSMIAPLGGVVVGVAVFLGVNITIGRAIIPSAESVKNPTYDLSKPLYPQTASAGLGAGAGGPYQAVCAACHQAEGQGMPGAFPPLAGSDWVIGNPEVPVRIVLLGLSGPIEVKGAKFNTIMPPPPGMTDATIAEAVTYARTHFGNKASEVTPEFVKKIRDSLGGRTTPYTADELTPLLGSPAGGAVPASGAGTAPPASPGSAAGSAAPTTPARP